VVSMWKRFEDEREDDEQVGVVGRAISVMFVE
jgi:hypothetical protein